MDADELVKVIGCSTAGVVAIIGACYAGARASLCRRVSVKSCCCQCEVERNPVDTSPKNVQQV